MASAEHVFTDVRPAASSFEQKRFIDNVNSFVSVGPGGTALTVSTFELVNGIAPGMTSFEHTGRQIVITRVTAQYTVRSLDTGVVPFVVKPINTCTFLVADRMAVATSPLVPTEVFEYFGGSVTSSPAADQAENIGNQADRFVILARERGRLNVKPMVSKFQANMNILNASDVVLDISTNTSTFFGGPVVSTMSSSTLNGALQGVSLPMTNQFKYTVPMGLQIPMGSVSVQQNFGIPTGITDVILPATATIGPGGQIASNAGAGLDYQCFPDKSSLAVPAIGSGQEVRIFSPPYNAKFSAHQIDLDLTGDLTPVYGYLHDSHVVEIDFVFKDGLLVNFNPVSNQPDVGLYVIAGTDNDSMTKVSVSWTGNVCIYFADGEDYGTRTEESVADLRSRFEAASALVDLSEGPSPSYATMDVESIDRDVSFKRRFKPEPLFMSTDILVPVREDDDDGPLRRRTRYRDEYY